VCGFFDFWKIFKIREGFLLENFWVKPGGFLKFLF
jgi:hypothetical protein